MHAVQAAIQEATGLAPSQPQPKPAEHHAPPAGFAGPQNSSGDASTNDVLKAVAQLLQQSQQVGSRLFLTEKVTCILKM